MYVPNYYTLIMNLIFPNDMYNSPYRFNLCYDTKASIARGTIEMSELWWSVSINEHRLDREATQYKGELISDDRSLITCYVIINRPCAKKNSSLIFRFLFITLSFSTSRHYLLRNNKPSAKKNSPLNFLFFFTTFSPSTCRHYF